jgi:uncharacterized membrane protein
MEFILFIIVIVLLFWVSSVSSKLKELEIKIKSLSGKNPVVVPIVEPKIIQPQNQSIFAQNGNISPTTTNFNASVTETLHTSSSLADAEKSAEPVGSETVFNSVDSATGWLNKIGVAALLLGMVFFFKYAVDQNWIGPWARVIIGFLVSGLLVYLGELWKEKYGSRAFALAGGGIALFYFCIFAAYQFYGLIPQVVAWALVLLVASLSVWLANRYSSLVLGILGFIGAYGSPLVLNSGHNQQISLFIYLTVLNLVILIISFRKFWVELLFLAMLGSVIDFSAWASNYSYQANTFSSLFFVIITTLLFAFTAAALLRYYKAKNNLPEFSEKNLSVVYLFVGAFYFLASWFLLSKDFHGMLPAIGLLGSLIFFIAYAVVDRLEYRALNYSMSLIGSGLLVFAAIWQYDGKPLAFALLLISLLGTSLGFLLKREELRVWALIILFASLFKSLFEPYSEMDKIFLFNAKFGLMFANTLAMVFVGWLYGKFKPSEFEKNVENGLQIVAAIILWFAVSWDIFSGLGLVSSMQNYMTLWWVIYPIILCAAAFASKRSGLMKLGVLLLCASLIKVVFLPYGNNSAFLVNAKFGLMFLQAIALLFVGILYSRNQEQGKGTADILYTAGSLFFWFTVSWEIMQYFNGNTQNLLLSLWWVVYAVILLGVSGMIKLTSLRKVSLALFALAILKVFLYDVQALDTPFRIIAFIVLGVILLSVSFSYNKNREKIVHFLEGEKEIK